MNVKYLIFINTLFLGRKVTLSLAFSHILPIIFLVKIKLIKKIYSHFKKMSFGKINIKIIRVISLLFKLFCFEIYFYSKN